MAKGKKKPASKPKVKKTEPIIKDEAIPVEDTTAPKKKAEKVTPKVEKPKKEKAPKKEKKEKIKIVEPIKATPSRAHVPSKYAFPSKEDCKHTETKRTIDKRLRVMHVCTNPACKKIVRFGSR